MTCNSVNKTYIYYNVPLEPQGCISHSTEWRIRFGKMEVSDFEILLMFYFYHIKKLVSKVLIKNA